MSDIDTSREAVERICVIAESCCDHAPSTADMVWSSWMRQLIAKCGALLTRAEAAESRASVLDQCIDQAQGRAEAAENELAALRAQMAWQLIDPRTPEEKARDLLSAYPDWSMPVDLRAALMVDVAQAIRVASGGQS